MTGIVIPCYNRPEYYRACLKSLKAANFPPNTMIMLVNDASVDKQTNDLYEDFDCPGAQVFRYRNTQNCGVRPSLFIGITLLFNKGCSLVINLDSDMQVAPNFIEELLWLKQMHPDKIVSGMNCTMLNEAGESRNPIIREFDHYYFKSSVGGPCLCYNKAEFEKYVRPNLLVNDNWDCRMSKAVMEAGKPIVVCKPSVVQHLGMKSSMGHCAYGAPDIATDFRDIQLRLPMVTLLGTDWKNPEGIKRAGSISQMHIEFGEVKIITDCLYDGREAYSEYYIKELTKLVDTDYVLIIHADGYVVNWKAWDDRFLDYDYIGATWWYKDNLNVGNGGFSLRSKKLLDILAKDPHIDDYHPEDDKICRKYRPYLEETYGIKFATEEVANRFAIEAYGVAPKPGNEYGGQFGFHATHVDFSKSDVPRSLWPTRFDFSKIPPAPTTQPQQRMPPRRIPGGNQSVSAYRATKEQNGQWRTQPAT